MTEPAPQAPAPPPYPTGITPEPFELDDLLFTPDQQYRMEHATRAGERVGELLLDIVPRKDGKGDDLNWLARKFDARGDMTDWMPMRSAAEGRAFLVSSMPIRLTHTPTRAR